MHGAGSKIRRIACGAAIAAVSFAPAASARERPNVLFIAVDDLRPELGTYGAPARTPQIDRLAREGVRFDRVYTAAAACAVSRAAMLTGAYPHTTRVVTSNRSLAEANPSLVSMPQVFKNAGYETVEVGKFLHDREDAPDAWSVDPWLPDRDPPVYLVPENRHMSGVMDVPRGPLAEGADVPDDAYLDGQIAARAISELQRLRDRPFFLAVGFVRPHLPFNCPARYWELYAREQIELPDTEGLRALSPMQWHGNYEPARYQGGRLIGAATARLMIHGYRACVSYIDAQTGRLLDALERLDLSDRTIVVFWGDHGWHLGEHGIWGKNTALEVALRVPLIVRAPGVEGGRSAAGLVESVDLLPTLCELAGIAVPQQVQGRSFAPLLHDPDRPWKRAVFGWRHKPPHTAQTVRTPRYRLVRWVSRDGYVTKLHATELYDHETDPREYDNVAGDPSRAEIVEELNEMLDAWLRREPVGLFEPGEEGASAGAGEATDWRVALEGPGWPLAAVVSGLFVWVAIQWYLRARRPSDED